MSGATPEKPAIAGTLRALSALSCLLGGAVVVGAILRQRPDLYWFGVALLLNGAGLARRLNWARIASVAGLAVAAAVSGLDAMKHAGAINLLVIAAAILLAARLWQHPEAFARRWW